MFKYVVNPEIGAVSFMKNCLTLTDQVFERRKIGALCRADITAIKAWRLFNSSNFWKT